MRNFSVLLLGLAFLTLSCEGYSDGLVAVNDGSIVVSDGLPNTNVKVMTQDSKGYVWIGTARGLCRYNGVNYHQYFSIEDSPSSLSGNNITGLLCDSDCRLWVTTTRGVSVMDSSGLFRTISFDGSSENMRGLQESPSGGIYITSGDHLLQYDPEEDHFTSIKNFKTGEWLSRFAIDQKSRIWMLLYNGTLVCNNPDGLADNSQFTLDGSFDYCTILPDGTLWATGQEGIMVWDTVRDEAVPVPALLQSNFFAGAASIVHIVQYQEDQVLFATSDQGLACYNRRTGALSFQEDIDFPFRARFKGYTSLMVDAQGNVWMGNSTRGFDVAYSNARRFNSSNLASFFMDRPVQDICHVPSSGEDEILVLTAGDELYCCKADGPITALKVERLPGGQATRCFVDSKGRWWIANNFFLYCCRRSGDRLLVERSYRITRVMTLLEDRDGTIWVGSFGSTVRYLRDGETEFKEFQIHSRPIFSYTSSLTQLRNGKILAASFVMGLYTVDPDTLEVEYILDLFRGEHAMKTFSPTCVCESSNGLLYVGTMEAGLFKFNRKTDVLEKVAGLQCDEIRSLVEDKDNTLWIGTVNGLSKYDINSYEVSNFTLRDGIGGMTFNQDAIALWRDLVVVGGNHGISSFAPQEMASGTRFDAYFEDLYVDNQMMIPEGGAMLSRPQVDLPSWAESFAVSFSTNEYSEYSSSHFLYRLEGYDAAWQDAHDAHTVFYSHLSPGSYVLHLKSVNDLSNKDETETSIRIRKLPSFWKRAVMTHLVYPLLAALILLTVLLVNRRVKKSKQEAHEARMNMNFLANISHEFRTPLMMISGPVSILKEKENLDDESKSYLGIVDRNVVRMLSLVNQMMEFGKLEDEALKLQVSETDVLAQLRALLQSFTFSAGQKHIELEGHCVDGVFRMLLDADKLDKICVNLLSNAVKFTPTGGRIDVYFEEITREQALEIFPLGNRDTAGRWVCISVEDNGIGIPKNKREAVFERFTRLDNVADSFNHGTGIGLYFVRKLVQMHHGHITILTPESGTGSRFSFILPVSHSAYNASEIVKAHSPQLVSPLAPAPVPQEETVPDAQHPTMLLVEDDVDAMNYLQTLFSPYYNVICRFDASVAYHDLEVINPDIILSDVVIPGMDGFRFCSLVKGSLETSHIPLILLSARTGVEDQVKGLESGADAYVTKPFVPSYLIALAKSHLDNRAHLREALSRKTSVEDIHEDEMNPRDRYFMRRVYEIMETELSASDLNVDKVTELMKMSRTKFYNKFKSLMHESPNAFFKRYKLNRAAELIREGKFNISEIADKTGFATLSFFSTSFKAQFGVSPSEYGYNK